MPLHYNKEFTMGNTENIEAERDYLHLLRNRHLQWMKEAIDPEIYRAHGEILDLLEQTTERFEILLKALKSKEINNRATINPSF
jgi:hypothetical protein